MFSRIRTDSLVLPIVSEFVQNVKTLCIASFLVFWIAPIAASDNTQHSSRTTQLTVIANLNRARETISAKIVGSAQAIAMKKAFQFSAALILAICAANCAGSAIDFAETEPPSASAGTAADMETKDTFARVEGVTVRRAAGTYTFAVTISSPDTGCDRYADWWEVLMEEGELLQRRVLGHTHVREQPFTRSGRPVTVPDDRILIVRAHMHPTGYGNQALRGTVAGGFEEITLPHGFAAALAAADPQPPVCAF